jgi:GTP cyclohydrolase I
MTIQIARELQQALNSDDVAVIIVADHMCVSSRGVQDTHSSTITAEYCGKFNDPAVREELLKYIGL